MSQQSATYARALLTVVGDDATRLTLVADELAVLAKVFAESELRVFFENPRVTDTEKTDVLKKACGADITPEALNLTILLGANRALRELPAITTAFATLVDAAAGRVTAHVESASKLSKEALAEIVKSLETMTGKTVRTEITENAALLGGVRVKIGDDVIDASLAGKFQKFANELA